MYEHSERGKYFMRWIFLSNYYTHHQKPLCEELYEITKHQFSFFSYEKFSDDRKKLGWNEQADVPFVKDCASLDDETMSTAINEADIVLFGVAPLKSISNRLLNGKIVLKYSERVFKDKYNMLKWFPRLYRYWNRYGKYKSFYLLSAGAYTTYDFAIHGTFLNKSYKWGYFPETVRYDVDELMSKKEIKTILWCGRFIDWKHPDDALEIASRLKDEGYDFSLKLIGAGEMDDSLQKMVHDNDLFDCVEFLGSMSPVDVRSYMESAGIYLFTSDFHEGWGAVLNEAMNSGCATVSSHAAGAVPFLVKNNENGIIYKNNDKDDMYKKVKYLLDNPREQQRLGKNAYETIAEVWNEKVAAQRLTRLVQEIKDHGYCDLYDDGPCSKAPLIKNNWFKG